MSSDNSSEPLDANRTQEPKDPKVPKEEKSSSFLKQELTAFFSGIMFFTRLSVPSWVNHSMYWLSLSTVYFPLIGVIVAAFGFLFFAIAYYLFPGSHIIPAISYSLATIRFTGAFHEDGLADMCDGFGGGWRRESILRIMRDSCIGAFAGLGIVLFQLMKLGGVAYLLDTIPLLPVTSPEYYALIHPKAAPLVQHLWKLAHIAGVFVSAHVLARWSCTYLLHKYKYVENASAAGKEFLLTVTFARFIAATVSAAALVGVSLLALPSHDYVIKIVMAWIVTVYITVGMGRYVNRVIGGVIGDCLGAINQLVECSVYLVLGVNWIRVFGDIADLYLIAKGVVDSIIKN